MKQVQSSIADVETNNLLKRYDGEVYAKIKSNLDAELKSKKDEIEQTRIRTKELGNQKRWLDWVEKYADRVGAVEDFTNTFGEADSETIASYIADQLDDTNSLLPAATASEGYAANVIALKANEAVNSGKRVEIAEGELTI